MATVVGIITSLYLTVQHTRLKSGIQGSASFCSFGKYADCDVVNASPYSEIAGIPIAVVGACFFFLLFLIGLIAPPKSENFDRSQQFMAWLVGSGLLVDVVLFSIQIVLLRNFCVLCFLTYLANILHFVGNLKLAREKVGSLKARLIYILLRPGTAPTIIPGNTIALSLLAYLFFLSTTLLLPFYYRSQSQAFSAVDQAMNTFFAQWKEKKIRKIEVKPGDGVMGNPASKVQITEFSDFQCPFCKKAAFTLKTLLKPLLPRVLFVFKHFPLDNNCNPAVQHKMHPHACSLARLAYCANAKQKFWEYHDLVFFNIAEPKLHEGPESFGPEMASVFSPTEIKSCLNNEKSLHNTISDVSVGNSLSIRGTPAIFINGKQVTIPLTLESIQKLIEIEESLVPAAVAPN